METTSLTRIKVQLTDPSLKAQFFPLCLEVTVYMSLPSYKIFSIGSDNADLETHGIENQSGKGEIFKQTWLLHVQTCNVKIIGCVTKIICF